MTAGELVVLTPAQLEQIVEQAVERALARCQPEQPSEWLDAAGAAKLLGVHRQHVGRLARRGDLPSARVGRSYRFRRSDIERYLEAGGR